MPPYRLLENLSNDDSEGFNAHCCQQTESVTKAYYYTVFGVRIVLLLYWHRDTALVLLFQQRGKKEESECGK